MKLGIIGIGRVGGSLALYLKERGIDFYWWTRDQRKRREWKEKIGAPSSSPEEVFIFSELTFICIKDDKVEEFIKGLNLEKGKGAVHLSGTLGIDVLNPLRMKGFKTGSFHPIQSFPETSSRFFRNIYASFVGDEKIYRPLEEIFKGYVRILKVNETQKFLIHLASTISSNFFVSLLMHSERILKKGNLEINLLYPLIETTLNNVKSKGVCKSLTGPAKRGDFGTLAKHEKYLLENFPGFFKIYLEITRDILKNEAG